VLAACATAAPRRPVPSIAPPSAAPNAAVPVLRRNLRRDTWRAALRASRSARFVEFSLLTFVS